MRTRSIRRTLAVLALAFAAGCQHPRYAKYTSANGDFACEIPWGWAIILDSSGRDYTNATFTGPADPDFFKGVPSLSVRWYKYKAPHRLPDGTYEAYASADDFIRQMLRDVYGPSAKTWAGSDSDIAQALADNKTVPGSSPVQVAGAEGIYFVVFNTLKAPAGKTYGVVRSDNGDRAIVQRHAYVVLPMRDGFYAVIYPATQNGFETYRPAFFRLVNTLRILKNGP